MIEAPSPSTQLFLMPPAISVEEGVDRSLAMASRLAAIHPDLAVWYVLTQPALKRAKASVEMIRLNDREKIVLRITEKRRRLQKEYLQEEKSLSFAASLYNMDNEKSWRRFPGACDIVIYSSEMDAGGDIIFSLPRATTHFGRPAYVVRREILTAIILSWNISFARTNVSGPSSSWETLRSYEQNFRVFPHRDYIGWMGYVPHEIAADDLPEAAELVPIKGKGTVVVTVADNFDLGNPTHVAQANKVEVKLAELGMLPVVDKSLL